MAIFGSIFALSCALTWSLSVILFKKTGDDLNPIVLNLLKNCFGLALMVPTVCLIEDSFPVVPLRDLGILAVSGLLGIGLADAMVLKALKDIGASRMAVVECVYSPFVLLLSILFLGEALTPTRLIGGTMVVSALLLVSAPTAGAQAPRRSAGFLWGIAGLLATAAGIVMIKPLFATIPLFHIIVIRMVAGVVASLATFAFVQNKRAALGELLRVERKPLMLVACVLGTYVSMILWVAGFKYNDAGIAAVLNQTSTIFTVLFASFFLKERMSPAKWTAAALAAAGVVTMTVL